MCEKCKARFEKLKEALFIIVGEREYEKLLVMRDFLSDIIEDADDAKAAYFAIKTLIEVMEDENEDQTGIC